MARQDATRTACCIGCRPSVIPSVGSRDFLVARCGFHYEFVRYVERGLQRAGYSKAGSVEENILVPITPPKNKTVTEEKVQKIMFDIRPF